MSKRISRSAFIKGFGAIAAGTLGYVAWHEWTHPKTNIACRMLGPSRELGHALRGGTEFPPTSNHEKTKIAIIGGGIAGLSAGWWLKRAGINDFVILELEPEVGGNARSGKNAVSSYPWAAHYVPLANAESIYVQELFRELGIIQSDQSENPPAYNDLYLCHDPQERLLKDGVFSEGLVPKRGLQPSDHEQVERFFDEVRKFRAAVGEDGKPAFAIPLDLSSKDARFTKLDKLSMEDWLKQNQFDSKPLLWYVNYCCRDDYGSALENVSAWAGIHYFAGRRGKASNAEMNSVVTWPEGNGFLVHALAEKLGQHIRSDSLVFRVSQDDTAVKATYLDSIKKNTTELSAQHVIFAGPRFIAQHILQTAPENSTAIEYAPWMVANITVTNVPPAHGVGLCWDNVAYNSDSLGYVAAKHQAISTRDGEQVLTWYYPLSAQAPHEARGQLYTDSAEKWSSIVTSDLERMHPGITRNIQSIDLWPWGHGMVRPSVGFIWGADRERMKQPLGRIQFAHSDMSGISNFEEAQYHGVMAAQRIMEQLGTKAEA